MRNSVERIARETSELTNIAKMKKGSDLQTFGILQSIGNQRVEEYSANQDEPYSIHPIAIPSGESGRDRCRGHQYKHAGCVCARLRVHISFEHDCDCS